MSSQSSPKYTGFIRIYKRPFDNERGIGTRSNWFVKGEYYTIKDDGEKIIIKRHFLDVPKKAYKLGAFRMFTILSAAPIGDFEICEEETNEDKAVFYYK